MLWRHSYIAGFVVAFCCGLLVGYNILPDGIIGFIYCALGVACIKYALDNNILKLFCTLPYIIYTEIFIRHKLFAIPYLFITYLYIVLFSILLIRQKQRFKGPHSKIFILLIVYWLLELIDIFRTGDVEYARFLIFSSLALAVCAMWSSYNFLSPKLLNRCFEHIKYAGTFLTGMVFVAHLRGNIQYGLHSSLQSSNGLAPVQLSAYLGFVSILFFFSIMNSKGKNIIADVFFFLLTSFMLALTLSRGGLYFLGSIIFIYILLNRKQMKSYYLMVLALPILIFSYLFLVASTQGIIAERFEQQGTSGRDRLIRAGLILFSEHPLIGIGTANYNKAIEKENLFEEELGAHNEFIRSLAEHGLPGFFTYWLFYLLLFYEILKRKSVQREYAIYLFVLYCMVIVHNGLKISLQPLLLIFIVATPTVMLKRKTATTAATLAYKSIF